MASLHDLSVDLLYVIFSHIQSDKRLLHDAALSCRLFRDVAQRFFVRDVTISHSATCSRTKLFLRTMEERPDLVAHVHRLELDLLREEIHWPEEQHNIKRITDLLTNLREFRYSSRDYKIWHYEAPFPLKPIPGRTVRKVEWHHNMTIRSLCDCLRLPRIESVYCRELHGSPNDIHKHTQTLVRSSSLKHLHIGSSMKLPAGSFQHVLKMPLLLQSLRIDFYNAYLEGVEEDQITEFLEPVKQTLEELMITKPKGTLVAAGGTVNLSEFASLKKLALPFKFLFPRDAQPPFEAETLLPPGLIELKLFFIAFAQEMDFTAANNNYANLITWLSHMHVDGSDNNHYLRMPMLQIVVLEKAKYSGHPGDLHEDSVEDIVKSLKSFEDDGSGRLRVRYRSGQMSWP
ncbi:hypothetical protein CC80DRAFT_508571 [Byssothecium circinans]|uniref:F-box domain-containing protein n=1 Tax=Byssothecium circinans TaxID=147558 RepID=A0A6A5TJR6_9PLEO|nr:hypothetical protein CC80DRAFT_508571 [Byssothecium circinans]